MQGYNCTRLTPESFILNGVPGLEGTHFWPPSHFAPCTLWLYTFDTMELWAPLSHLSWGVPMLAHVVFLSLTLLHWHCLVYKVLYPKCSAFSGLISKSLASVLAWCRCSFSTTSQGWNLGCLCSWPWTTMWPSATLYALLLSSPILSLPRWVSHLPLKSL